jgi:hypothetical protein
VPLRGAIPAFVAGSTAAYLFNLRLFAGNRIPTSKPKQSSGFLAPKGVSWQHGESRIIQGLAQVNTDRGTSLGLVSLESEKPETYTSAGRSIRPYTERADVNDIFAEEARSRLPKTP